MSEIENPDEDGGIEPGTDVSFIVLPAKKGVQAAAVTVANPPSDNKETTSKLEDSFAEIGISGDGDKATDDANDRWGTWGD